MMKLEKDKNNGKKVRVIRLLNINKIEYFISINLRRYPKFRNFVKLTYQRSIYLVSKIFGKDIKNVFSTKAVRVTPKEREHFFGYYNISPWDITGRYILSLEVPFSDKHPIHGEKAAIGIIDTNNNNKFIYIAKTQTWNLQQGCMLQWLGPKFKDDIIFNCLINNQYVSIIHNIKTKERIILNLPIYSISKNGKHALSLNFSRLNRLRLGYGYGNLPDETKNDFHPANDGIWYLDIEKNKSKLIISLNDITKINWEETMKEAHHKFNHIEINPNGTRFMFIHRWESKKEKYSRLYTANLDGKDIYCLANDKMVSHCCWKNNIHILSWCRKKGIGDKYYLFTDKSKEFQIVGNGILNVDGHPSYSPDRRYILTDTYPDRTRMRTLIIYDTVEEEKYDIGKFFAPFKYDGDIRCDLHPRWDRDGKHICFDSVHEGKRQLYIIKNPLYKWLGEIIK